MSQNNWTKEFVQANKVSLEIAAKVEKVLKFNGLASLIPIVNTMSLSLKLPAQFRQLNSTICISPKGGGKSTLLVKILAKSNPKFFTVLDKNIFESLLLEKPKEYFNNKTLVHDDLISVFGGKNRKQREQLTSFFTQILSDGTYSRDGKGFTGITCIAHFGIAQESFQHHRKDLLDSTFLDRSATYSVKLTVSEKREVLEYRDKMVDDDIQLPTIKLPLTKKKKEVKLSLDKDEKTKVNDLAMELDMYNILSSNRAKNYISIFLMANALLNGRDKISRQDLQLYEIIHRYHLESSEEVSKEHKVLALKQRFPNENNAGLMEKSGLSKSTYYRIERNLRRKGLI